MKLVNGNNNEGNAGGKTTLQVRRKTPKIAPLIALTLIFTIIPLYYPYIRYSTTQKLLSKPAHLIQPTASPSLDHPLYRSQNQIQPAPTTTTHHSSNPENRKEEEEKEEEEETKPQSTDNANLEKPKENKDEELEVAKDSKPLEGKRTRKRKEKNSKRRRRRRRDDNDNDNDNDEVMLGKKIPQGGEEQCDLFNGEWVENAEGPYYTNETCWAIQEHQNCMKFGRPDRGFLKWKWKPYACELPVFHPSRFLQLMRGKALAFVGDSVARNHMQSLICLLSRVTYPVDVSNTRDENFKRWEYREYDFNISIFWSPYLVRTQRTDPKDITKPFNLYLDEFDETWTTEIGNFDYVIISAGHWFFRPTMFYLNGRLNSCLYCAESNIVHRPWSFSYRRAFRTALRAINSLKDFKGIAFVRSYAPSHFEGGPWDKGGDCARTRPFRSNEVALNDYNLEMYNIQKQEYRIGERAGRRLGTKLRLIDTTKAMMMRPDGHPSKFGHWPALNITMPNDCVHWCLPGPIDTWNDFLQAMLIRENRIRS